MLLRHSRNIGWFRTALVFVALITGLVGSSVDLIQNHLTFSAQRQFVRREDPDGPCRPHVERCGGTEYPPCNACFFNKLLGQTIVPVQRFWCDRSDSVPLQLRRVKLLLSIEPAAAVNRGPPAFSF